MDEPTATTLVEAEAVFVLAERGKEGGESEEEVGGKKLKKTSSACETFLRFAGSINIGSSSSADDAGAATVDADPLI